MRLSSWRRPDRSLKQKLRRSSVGHVQRAWPATHKPRRISRAGKQSWPMPPRHGSTLTRPVAPTQDPSFSNRPTSAATGTWCSRPASVTRDSHRVVEIPAVERSRTGSSLMGRPVTVMVRRSRPTPATGNTRRVVQIPAVGWSRAGTSQESFQSRVMARWPKAAYGVCPEVVQGVAWALAAARVVVWVRGCWVGGRRCRRFSPGSVPGIRAQGSVVLAAQFRGCRRRLVVG